MRVLILLPGYSANDSDWAIPVQRHLMRALSALHDVRVLALRYPHRRDRYTIDGVQVDSLGWAQARGARRLLLWRDALAAIARLHYEQPFDVIHAMWADETGALAIWAARRLRVRSVVSLLGGELARLDDIGYGLQRGRFSRWVVGQALRADAVTSPSSYIDGLLTKAGYLVPSTHLHRWIMGVNLTPKSPLGVQRGDFQKPLDDSDTTRRVPTASDSPSLYTETRKRLRGEVNLIAVGSLIPVKDHATLLRALARLEGVSLDLVGDGALRGDLERLARELDIAARVRFVGSVSHLDLPAYYQRAAIHVLPSRHEANPMALLEAASCGVPTIGSAVGILPDDPRLGIAVPPQDVDALTMALQSLLEDPARLAALRVSARAAVEESYRIKQSATAITQVYNEAIDRRVTS
jgi:glycosyltransferase involved in cell wall biosynthesis